MLDSLIASCFDEFIEKGKKIPENAWIGYPINIEGLILDNSNPYPRWLKSERVKVLNYIGPYNIKTWDRYKRVYITDNYLEEKLPEDFDISMFGMSFDYKPNSSNVTGGILRINRDFEICVGNG